MEGEKSCDSKKREEFSLTATGVGELDRIVPSSPPDFTATRVGENGPDCPSVFLLKLCVQQKART